MVFKIFFFCWNKKDTKEEKKQITFIIIIMFETICVWGKCTRKQFGQYSESYQPNNCTSTLWYTFLCELLNVLVLYSIHYVYTSPF